MLVQAEIDCGTADVQIEVPSGKSEANINSAEGLWELLDFSKRTEIDVGRII